MRSPKIVNEGITTKDLKNIERLVCFLFSDILENIEIGVWTIRHPRAAYEATLHIEIVHRAKENFEITYEVLKILVRKYFRKRPGPIIFRKFETLGILDVSESGIGSDLQFVEFKITVTVPPRNDLFAQTPVSPRKKIR